jgi:Polysaccharide lyase family 4, domain II
VRGVVQIEGTVPGDSVVHPISDQEVCGDSLVDVVVEHDGDKLAGAVVWLVGVKGGKRLPLERRYELDIEGCTMRPRTQAVLVGGTLNVRNADKVVHKARFVRQGTRDPLAVARYSDDGQVVPVSAALERPGLVEARCDVHPWSRAWVAVFDQPYFAVTRPDGSFTLDSVPPGKYELVAWHPRLGVVRDTVRVGGGGEASVTLRLKGK